jgi:uncharacterized Zn finger protein (UPF0148 family)
MEQKGTIMFCPQCGAPNEDDAVFCGNCGAVLNPDELDTEAGAKGLQAAAEGETPEEAPEGTAEAREEEATRLTPIPDDLPAVPPPPPPPPPRPVQAGAVQTSGMAIASLVMGVAGWTLLPLVGSILAIIFGNMARREIRQRPDEVTGDGLAVAGLVLGWLSVGVTLLVVCLGGLGACFFFGILGASGGY